MSDNDEIDFIEQAGKDHESDSSPGGSKAPWDDDNEYGITDDSKGKKLGQPVQYSHYGPGFKPTTATINSLPAGCYDIEIDQNGYYASPMPKPTGLLLELPEMRSEAVIDIVENFWNSEKDYKDGNQFVRGGAAFKAGIMVYGPPGTGKSCTIKIVSNKLVERGGTVFFASINPTVVNAFLTDFGKIEKDRKCIVILEDIDSLIANFGESGYLDMLDSAKSIDNVLFIATTNYPERLDPRIYNRPGRFSHVVKVGLPGPKGREAFLRAILKDDRDIAEIVNNTDKFSIDHLSALINAVYREKKDMHKEIKRLRTLFQMPKSDDKSIGLGFTGGSKVED
jgi:hypothetical protein